MSMLLLNKYHESTKPNAHIGQSDPEPPPGKISASPQPPQDERNNWDSKTDVEHPKDPKSKLERALKKAQAQWSQRREAGYEEYGTEMGKEAKVWQIYVKESDRMDQELVEGWNKSLDVLLIFAALFSAVSTAFVIVSSEGLQQDPADGSAQTLLIISQALVAISNGQPVNASATTEQDQSASFNPTRTAMIVNTLWYFSLSLSVAVSLVAMLAKEWCYSFMANRTGQMYEQGRRRQERWNGILRWKMMDVIAFLPMVMHTALFLFALGLCVYLWSICVPVAIPVVATTATALLIYFSTTALPLVFDFCPYTTTSSKLLYSYLKLLYPYLKLSKLYFGSVFVKMHHYYSLIIDRMANPSYREYVDDSTPFKQWKGVKHRVLLWADQILEACAKTLRPSQVPGKTMPFADPKLIMANGRVPMDIVTSEMLAWLLANSEDNRVTTIALQSLAGADPWLPRLPLVQNGALRMLHQSLEGCLELDVKLNEYQLRDPAQVHSASVYLRGLNFILSFHNSEGFYLEYPFLRWAGYRYHLACNPYAEPKNTWNFDVDAAKISGLLTAGTHGSELKLSMDYPGLPELVLFGNLRPQAVKYHWSSTAPRHVDHAERQTNILTLLGEYIDETTIVHTHAIATMVRCETELLCARYMDNGEVSAVGQLAFPLMLVKLSSLPLIRKDLEALHAIAVALVVTAFVFVEGSIQKYPPMHLSQTQSRPSVATSYHYQSKVLKNQRRHYLSLEASRRKETESLLTFGLLALFEHSDAHALCNADVAAIARAIETVGRNQSPNDPITYAHIYTLSEDFTYSYHSKYIVERLCNPNLEDSMLNEVDKWRCIQALHSIKCLSNECNHYIDHLKRWLYAENAELRAIILDMIGAKGFPHYPPEQELHDLLSTSEVLVKLDSTVLLSINAQDTLIVMELLWKLVEWIYKNRDESGRQVLSSITPESDLRIPDSIWKLGLIERWLPKLKSVCTTEPQLVIQSRVFKDIFWNFESEWLFYRQWNRFRGIEDPPSKTIERAVQRYQQNPDQCRQTPSVEAIHKLAFECVLEHRKQNRSALLQPPPDIRISGGVILPDRLESSSVAPDNNGDTQSRILPDITEADIC